MRFTLAKLFAMLSFSALFLSLYLEHGLLAIVFIAPTVGVVLAAQWVWRRSRRFAVVILFTYFALWLVTSITSNFTAMLFVESEMRSTAGEQATKLAFDPIREEPMREYPEPWYYVGNSTAPCPLIASIDHGAINEHGSGFGGREYFLSLPAYPLRLFSMNYWAAD